MEGSTIEFSDCSLRIFAIVHLDESKSAWLARITVGDNVDAHDQTVSSEQVTQLSSVVS